MNIGDMLAVDCVVWWTKDIFVRGISPKPILLAQMACFSVVAEVSSHRKRGNIVFTGQI